MSGNSTNALLSFEIKKGDDCETTQTGSFSLSYPDMGELYGMQSAVHASKGGFGSEFSVGEGGMYPHLTAASQSWYGE
jgi:hypothetical protein